MKTVNEQGCLSLPDPMVNIICKLLNYGQHKSFGENWILCFELDGGFASLIFLNYCSVCSAAELWIASHNHINAAHIIT
jgi:hypothetical protein